jgi:hypothetical protein
MIIFGSVQFYKNIHILGTHEVDCKDGVKGKEMRLVQFFK